MLAFQNRLNFINFTPAFDKYDDDGGGTITLDEFREFLNAFLSK